MQHNLRLNRRNAQGLYDVIHLETNSSLVRRPNDSNIEVDLAAAEAKIEHNAVKMSDSTPTKLAPGKWMMVANTVYIGNAEGDPVDITTAKATAGSGGATIMETVPETLNPGTFALVGSTLYFGDTTGKPNKLFSSNSTGGSGGPLQPGETVVIDGKVYVGDENGNPVEIFTGEDNKPTPEPAETVPETLEPGKIIIVNGEIYIGSSGSLPIKVVDTTIAETKPTGTTSSDVGKMFIIGNKIFMVDTDGTLIEVGTSSGDFGGDPNDPIITTDDRVEVDMLPVTGTTFSWMGYTWRVVHVTNKKAYAMLEDVHLVTHFGDGGVYNGSTIEFHARDFMAKYLKDGLGILNDITVEGVTCRVFVPTYDQVTTEFDYLKTQANRKAKMNNAPTAWWVSTSTDGVPWYVNTEGQLVNTAADTAGFRPFICIDRTKIKIPAAGISFEYNISFPGGVVPVVGDKILYGGYNWLVQHITDADIFLCLDELYGISVFGKNNTYSGSVLEQMADSFLSTIDQKTLETCDAIEVSGVTKKVFPPTYTQIMGDFDRTAGTKANRIFKYEGTAHRWWTATACADLDCDKLYTVDADGNAVHDDMGRPNVLNGFLPHIAVNRAKVHGAAPALGSAMKWAGYDWIICHVTDTQIVLALSTIHSKTAFGSNTNYVGSTLASVAKQFENSIDKSLLAQAMDTTVNGVTAKIFVASREQMNGGFSYFNSDAKRVCKYNGSADWYWTSSPNGSGGVYFVYSAGGISNGYGPSGSGGFRPFVALKRV